MLPRIGSLPLMQIAASEKSGPASRFHVPNWTMSILSPLVEMKLRPKSPANQRACNSSSEGMRGETKMRPLSARRAAARTVRITLVDVQRGDVGLKAICQAGTGTGGSTCASSGSRLVKRSRRFSTICSTIPRAPSREDERVFRTFFQPLEK